ncbi:fimbrial protein [Vibrio galatheae]|uniref:Fimbrial protein n=1 Tax=Vibrio galatheae TaxID=579748 RepID=A0A0F4NIL9_9VIBR|nr:fimbrial protein [Vibrio galatheae]KJY82965.1 fimbrial protein [Vibrio galatheae]
MKKTVSLSAIAALSLIALNAQAASVGTITFNGEVTASTCNVTVDSQAADATVQLPTVSTNLLGAAGETAGATAFNVSLSGCMSSLDTATMFFEAGSSVDLVTGRLNNTSGSASNVSLQLRDGLAPTTVIKAGSAEQLNDNTYANIQSGSADLPYIVEYYADDAATAGTVVSNVTYSIQYK